MSMNTPTGSMTQTTAIKDFIELENIDTQQYLLGINNIATGDGSKIKLEKILKDSISTDTGNTLEIGSDNKLLNIEEDTGVQAGDYTYPQNLVVNSKGRITSVTSGSPVNVPIATTLQAGIVKPDGNTITVASDGTINANLNGKADVDLTNVNNAGASKGAGWAMPSDTYVDLTLGASGATYTAPANGYFWCRNRPSSNGGGLTMQIKKNDVIIYDKIMKTVGNAVISDILPVKKNDILSFYYDSGKDTAIRFIYAQGSESEAQ